MEATDLLIWGTVAHLIADWFFQNDWMAVNKVNPIHPAAYVHGGIHFVCMLAVFPVMSALYIALMHILIDFRTPLITWRSLMRQALPGNPFADHVKIWQDQAAHVLIVATAAIGMSW